MDAYCCNYLISQVFTRRFNLKTGEVIKKGLTSPHQKAIAAQCMGHRGLQMLFQEEMTKRSCANNLVSSLLAIQGFQNFAQARRLYDARPQQALAIIFGL
jgi:hypothetical protein